MKTAAPRLDIPDKPQPDKAGADISGVLADWETGIGGNGQYGIIFFAGIAKTIFRLGDKDKEKHLMVFWLQVCCEKPNNDEYYKALLESLAQYFKIPLEAHFEF